MAQVRVSLADKGVYVECRALCGREALGEVLAFDLEVIAPEPVDATRVLGKACAIVVDSRFGERVLHGVVTRFVAMATAQAEPSRRYELTVRSRVHLLSLRRRTRVFQHLSVPAVVQKVLRDAGFEADEVVLALAGEHAEREYVVQYAEDDLSFVRRLCEEEGLYFRFEPRDGFDAFVLEDTSARAPAAADAPLPLVDGAELTTERATAWDCRELRRRRPGKVTLRDYDFEHPAVELEGVATSGVGREQGVEVYRAPGRFKATEDGAERARVALESLRAEARTIRLQTTAVTLAPGLAFQLEAGAHYEGAARPEGQHLVVAIEHGWRADMPRYEITAMAIPLPVPCRLARRTPKPRIAGLHSAMVTGPEGQEVHPDAVGRVRVRFVWDREGPTDHTSSLPVRVAQPNLPGSLLIPRVGWEVIVAFEDGDPDRPVIVGRAYNAKRPPPFALPANKTITSLATASSPGGQCQNSVHFDDAAGRQHMAWSAGSGKTTIVANNMMTQTVGSEVWTVGPQAFAIGGSDKVSVKQVFATSAATQSLSVGGSQTIRVKADMSIATGSESVAVGGLLFERVGNPVNGAIALAEAAALAGAGAKLGSMLQSTQKVGPLAKAVLGHALGPALAAIDGAVHGAIDGGLDGAAEQAGLAAAQAALGHVPGMDAVTAAVLGTGFAPWHTPAESEGKGAAAPGGGAGAPSTAATGPTGPGPGHRVTNVGADMTELIGGPHGVMTPGMIRWTTLGLSTFVVGGNHNIQAANVSSRTMGASTDSAASMSVNATGGDIARVVRTGLHRKVGGALTVSAGKDYRLKAGGALNVKIGGSLSLTGGMVVFHCGGSTMAVSSGGVLLKASSVTINGKAQQSGKATTP